MQKLPHAVFAYIRHHFPEGHLSNAESFKDKHGHLHFNIEVNENEVIHFLEFNEQGNLMKHSTAPVFKEDYYEGGFYGERE